MPPFPKSGRQQYLTEKYTEALWPRIMDSELQRLVMAVGAHADDLEVSVGGTLLKYRDLGYDVLYVMATNNMSGVTVLKESDDSFRRVREAPREHMARRKRECASAAAVLGTEAVHLDHPQRHHNTGNGNEIAEVRYGSLLPEGVAQNVPSILTACEDKGAIGRLADLILERDPEIILTHGVAQRNIEHFATCLLVTNAFWSAVERGYAGGLLHWREAMTLHGDYNTRWETHVKCDGYLDAKMALIGKHACQMPTAHLPTHGHRQLSDWRGKLAGCETAEFFTWVRRPARASTKITGSYAPLYGELTMELLQNTQ